MRNRFIFVLAAAALAAGCSTVAPKPVVAKQPSFDAVPDAKGDVQNSGILGFTNGLAIITPTARDRYNALCAKWGKSFVPPLTPPDAGLRALGTNLWLMDKDHLDKFATMTGDERNKLTTPKPP
jgi:hypothetical protein